MALNSASRLTNIHDALDTYLDTLGFSVHRHGVRRFIPPVTAPWIRAHYGLLGMQRRAYRQVADTEVGDELIGTVDLVLAQHARTYATRYTLAATRDTVVAAFPPGGLIPVYDADDGDRPQIGHVYIDGVHEQFLDDGGTTGLVQHALTIRVRYIEATTQPW